MKEQFDFRQFCVRQDRCAMKVGTDGVLLGAWAQLPPEGRLLDIGTGTGLIALMAAQRTRCHVTGVELDAKAAAQAAENATASPWSDRVGIVQADIAAYETEIPFDAALSNPPYYDSSLLPPDTARAVARHTGRLTFDQLTRSARGLLRPKGKLHVVLPAEAEEAFLSAAAAADFYPTLRTVVRTRPEKPPRRVLLTLDASNSRTLQQELLLHGAAGNERTAEYEQLTRDFYIS